MPRSSRCWWRRFLLLWSSVSRTILGATDETLDEVHILCNDCLIDAMGLEITEESNPRWVDARRCKAFL
jgi:hypothetical protein